ncbi:MAG: Plasmid stabilization system [Patescibacteria group bacterium]|nr:Plasmid stabilization system [Patescibacteria group bacterium]
MKIALAPQFRRQFKKLPRALQEEAVEKMELFRDTKNHLALKVHKLHGRLNSRLSFSVNYRYRIIFMWEVANESAIMLAIGDHALYD